MRCQYSTAAVAASLALAAPRGRRLRTLTAALVPAASSRRHLVVSGLEHEAAPIVLDQHDAGEAREGDRLRLVSSGGREQRRPEQLPRERGEIPEKEDSDWTLWAAVVAFEVLLLLYVTFS